MKPVSAPTEDLLGRLREHYRAQGKASAAANYYRHLRAFFSWAEAKGWSVANLPAEAVESFLAESGMKETTAHVMRTQIRSAMREAHTAFGAPFGHIEYQTGKPAAVRQAQKAREKERRAEARAQEQGAMTDFQTPPEADEADNQPAATPAPAPTPPAPPKAAGAGAAGQPTIIVNVPPQKPAPAAPQKPLSTVGAPPQQPQARGVVLNNHTFSGAYIKISRIADGSDPLAAPGTEVYITTLPASQLAAHGDVAAYLQTYIVPNLRLAPTASQIHFVFSELNDRRQPTGRRDELAVSVPAGTQPAGTGFAGYQPQPAEQKGPSFDRATEFLLKRLDEDAAAAKKRADELGEKLRQANDAQTTFMLMQQMQKETDLRRELEERRRLELDRLSAPLPSPSFVPPMPLMPPLPPEPVRPDPSIEMVRAMSEQQARMMEVMLAANKPQPVAQKDTAEWVLPLITQMQQQAMAQAQANQQMLVQIMQGNQQFLQQMMQRESPELSILREELKEVRAAAQAPKDTVEEFAEKFQKMQAVTQMMGGGGGGGGLLSDLLSNAESIGIGASRVIAAMRNNGQPGSVVTTPRPQTAAQKLDAMPFVEQPSLPAAQAQPQAAGAQAAPAPQAQPQMPPPPPEAVNALNEAAKAAVAGEEEPAVHAVIGFLQHLTAGPDPYPAFAQRILSAFRMADDEADLFVLSKSLWTVISQKAPRESAQALSAIFAKWYGLIHQSVFGEPRELGEREPMTDAEADQTAAVQAAAAAQAAEQEQEGEEEEEEAPAPAPRMNLAAVSA